MSKIIKQLTNEEIASNKEKFISLVRQISIQGADIDGLISYLTSTDFFEAPASIKFAGAYPGGLCQQSLKIYKTLLDICNKFDYTNSDSILIVGLFSNLYKANLYKQYIANEKFYYLSGSKSDELGNYDWINVTKYAIKDAYDRELTGSKGLTNVMRLQKYIPLSEEEFNALNNYLMNPNTDDLPYLANKFNLLVYLHCANMLVGYCEEKVC